MSQVSLKQAFLSALSAGVISLSYQPRKQILCFENEPTSYSLNKKYVWRGTLYDTFIIISLMQRRTGMPASLSQEVCYVNLYQVSTSSLE